MNKELLITLIYKDLEELKVLTKGFSEMENFPKTLVDLAVDKAKNIADCLQKLPCENQEPRAKSQDVETKMVEEKIEEIEILEDPKIEEEIKVAETQPNIVIEQPKVEEINLSTSLKEIEEKVEILEEPTIEEEVVVETLEEQQEVEEQIEIAETQSEIVFEQPKIEEKIEPIIEKVEPKIETPATKLILESKVSDLKQAFSIADRFRFERELFDSNGEKFLKALADFNKMETLEQAQNYIANNLKFDLETSAVQAFIEILKRKLN